MLELFNVENILDKKQTPITENESPNENKTD